MVPRLDRPVCLAFDTGSDGGGLEDSALPDVRGWAYGGRQQLDSSTWADLWTYEAR